MNWPENIIKFIDQKLMKFSIYLFKQLVKSTLATRHQTTTTTSMVGDPTQTQTTQFTAISSLINVNNLSNQTFVYIINWLKQQQMQQQNQPQVFTSLKYGSV